MPIRKNQLGNSVFTPPAIAQFTAIKETYRFDDDVTNPTLDITSLVAISTVETIGKVGSGAANEVAALNIVPDDAKYMIFRADMQVSIDFQIASSITLGFDIRKNGFTAWGNHTQRAEIHNQLNSANAILGGNTFYSGDIYAPLDANGLFEIQWFSTIIGGTGTPLIRLYLVGFQR